jgi:hypothetical protein
MARQGRRGARRTTIWVRCGLGAPLTAEALSGAPLPPWDDDCAWLWLWRTAGPALTHREPVARAWIAAAPEQPLPRTLTSVELRRIAAQHGIAVEVALQNAPPAPREDAPDRDLAPIRSAAEPTSSAPPPRPYGPPRRKVPEQPTDREVMR